MKTAEYYTFIGYKCPYKTCCYDNEQEEPIGDSIAICEKCGRQIKLI